MKSWMYLHGAQMTYKEQGEIGREKEDPEGVSEGKGCSVAAQALLWICGFGEKFRSPTQLQVTFP